MELLRRFRALRPEALPNPEPPVAPTDVDTEAWEHAFLGRYWFQGNVCCATLALRSDDSKKAYAYMSVSPRRVSLDIPLLDHTPQETLLQKAYETTFFGEVVPERYRAFAKDEFNRDHLLAFLNRKKAGVSPDEVLEWFYATFGVKHLKKYGSIYLSSHGGVNRYGYDYFATIERSSTADSVDDITTRAAIDFANDVQKSLPHLSVEPLPVDAYLQDLQSTLKFLPRDWDT